MKVCAVALIQEVRSCSHAAPIPGKCRFLDTAPHIIDYLSQTGYRAGRDRWPLWAAIDTAGTGLLTKAVIPWERGLLRRYRRQRSYVLCAWLHPSAEAVTTITTAPVRIRPWHQPTRFVTIRSRNSDICALQADGIAAWRKAQRQHQQWTSHLRPAFDGSPIHWRENYRSEVPAPDNEMFRASRNRSSGDRKVQ